MGKVGCVYGVKIIFYMYVIDLVGRLVYMGVIDDKFLVWVSSLNGVINYVCFIMVDMDVGCLVKLV